MALPVQVRAWFEGRAGYAAEALAATRRWAEMQTEKRELQLEEDALLHERLNAIELIARQLQYHGELDGRQVERLYRAHTSKNLLVA